MTRRWPSGFRACPAAAGRRCETLIRFVADRPGHDRRYAIDAGKIERELGFEPNVSFEDGLRMTLRWYLENEPWWRAVMDGSYRSVDRQPVFPAGRVIHVTRDEMLPDEQCY